MHVTCVVYVWMYGGMQNQEAQSKWMRDSEGNYADCYEAPASDGPWWLGPGTTWSYRRRAGHIPWLAVDAYLQPSDLSWCRNIQSANTQCFHILSGVIYVPSVFNENDHLSLRHQHLSALRCKPDNSNIFQDYGRFAIVAMVFQHLLKHLHLWLMSSLVYSQCV